jgi:hypothetical protein
LAQLLSTIDLVRAHLNPAITVSTVLLTMYDGRTRLADQVADDVRQHFGDLVVQSVIPRNVRVSEAPGFGQTVITYDPGSRGATRLRRRGARSGIPRRRGYRSEGHPTRGRAGRGNRRGDVMSERASQARERRGAERAADERLREEEM